jgi:hypothetical protein
MLSPDMGEVKSCLFEAGLGIRYKEDIDDLIAWLSNTPVRSASLSTPGLLNVEAAKLPASDPRKFSIILHIEVADNDGHDGRH